MNIGNTGITTRMQHFNAEPQSKYRNSITSNFKDIVSSALKTAVGAAGSAAGVDVGNYQGLIDQQLQLQKEMMNVSLVSNLNRTEHETRMAAVRNTRVA